MTDTEHSMLSNRYRLLERLATGGMGEVWRAEDELLGRDVAIKILKDEYAGDETFRIRFRAEARNTAGLSHPGIAQMYDYGEQADIAYLVMELVPGQPLSEILYRNERLSPEVTLEIIAQAARALQAAHDADLIHRDIKPGNLIVDPDGLVKVTDFGIARVVNAATMTQTGTVLGTAQYVSPEQAEGRPLTPATDVYSLGIVAYECLSGHTPFTGESAVAIALAHVRDEPPALPEDVPGGVRDLIGRCLSKDPEHRPPSAGELSNVAYMARESLRMGDTGPETAVAAPAAMAGAGVAGGVSAESEDGMAPHAETETPLHESAPASGEATAAAEGDTGGNGATPPFGTLGVAGAATEAGGVTSLDAAPHAALDEPETADSTSYRRRVLLIAGAMSVAVICAGALMLAFRWDALFNPAGYPNEGNVPPAVPDSTSPSWRLSPGWDTSDPSQRTQRGGAGVPGVDRSGGASTDGTKAAGSDDDHGDGDGSGGGSEPDPPDTPGPGDSNTATGSPTSTGGPTGPSPTGTNGGGDDDDTGGTDSPSPE